MFWISFPQLNMAARSNYNIRLPKMFTYLLRNQMWWDCYSVRMFHIRPTIKFLFFYQSDIQDDHHHGTKLTWDILGCYKNLWSAKEHKLYMNYYWIFFMGGGFFSSNNQIVYNNHNVNFNLFFNRIFVFEFFLLLKIQMKIHCI
jgi:hypothetical protein